MPQRLFPSHPSPVATCKLQIGCAGPSGHPKSLSLPYAKWETSGFPYVPTPLSSPLQRLNRVCKIFPLPAISSHQDRAGSLLFLCAVPDDFPPGPTNTEGWDLRRASWKLAKELQSTGLSPLAWSGEHPGEPFAKTESAYAFE